MVKKVSPNRRKSIAVPNQNLPSLVPKNRRRAHSIVPGASLSPLAKARRSLAPRKSILKASVNVLNLESSSQPSTQQSQSTDDATGSMEETMDFTAPIHDNSSRKSFGRRVSFASHSHVRMFEPNHTNSTGSPQSSPSSVPEASSPSQGPTDENDYPGQNSRPRRSSARFSMAGSEDMDLTTVIAPGGFQRGSAILDEEFDDFDYDQSYGANDMDVTKAIHGDFARKRSLSMGVRQPLAQLSAEDSNESHSDVGNESVQSEGASEAMSEESQAMEFTIPLGQSLRPPPEKDEAWLALKQMTHSGNEPTDPDTSSEDVHGEDEMDLDNAMARLRRARDSLPLIQVPLQETHDESFTSTEDSFDEGNDGNKTLNLSQVLGRASLGANSRMSTGYQESNMDESEVYGNIGAVAQPTPRHSLDPQQRAEPEQVTAPLTTPTLSSSVFRPPPPDANPKPSTSTAQHAPKLTTPTPFSFTPRAPSPSKSRPTSSESPSKAKPKPTFSAAFAPPVSRPSPKKPAAPTQSHDPPAKRPHSTQTADLEHMDVDKPSPAKKQTLVSKWQDATEKPPSIAATPASASKPRPLSPSKKVLFEAPYSESAQATSRPPSALRRPSGYFAKRKSLAVGFSVPSESTQTVMPSSPKKKAGIGLGRVSLGSAPADAWTRFDKDAGSGVLDKPVSQKGKEKEVEAAHSVRETTRQATAVPSPTRGSPAPTRVAAPTPAPRELTPEPQHSASIVRSVVEAPEVAELSQDIEVDTDATQQWREGVQQSEFVEEGKETPAISITQFFSMTNIKFMDELTAPRRSIHPSQQPTRQPRSPTDIPLAEYVTAMAIDIPQLDLYSRVSRDLEGWMCKSRLVFAQAEEEAAKVTPELFVEYARADEEGQAELMHQLNLIKTHVRYQAKSDWYDWKLQWIEGLHVTADEEFVSLENDARALEDLKKSIDGVLPELEKEYEELMLELEQEQAEVKEIEESDQDYLNELKATIAEQNIEVEALKAEIAEGSDQVRWLQERVDEIEAQKREAKNTISTAARVLRMKQTSTRSEVFRLRGELEALEDLHMFRISKVNADLFEYVYASLFQVSIPCRNFVPIVTKVNITRYAKAGTRYKDDFPKLSAFLLATAKYHINESEDLTVRQIVHRLNDYWSSCAQLRSQLTLLSIKYPVDIVVPPPSPENPSPSFKARAAVMFPSKTGRAFISFMFSFNTLSQWPMSLNSLDCEVDVAYGSMERSEILKSVMDRLSQATPSENYACLLDACIEAQELYLRS
ncbi:unnamed protein product [Cyclocybe aegerita]|uniref:Spc7 kinetochore protein domain-containing protein n=1 Tax=Cyclocybe aegerita TaxID=1973307 RepID=A0A8S0WC87_CYCAE|nr:unnamed protein product [Cyclocybe aegerita]